MTPLWPRVNKHAKVIGAFVVAVGITIAALVMYLVRRHDKAAKASGDLLERAVDHVLDKVQEANAQAGVEIAIARTSDRATRTELASILADKDGEQRRRRLISLHERVTGGSQ